MKKIPEVINESKIMAQEYHDYRVILNTLKTYFPIIRSLILFPGENRDDAQRNAQLLVNEVIGFSTKLADAVGIDHEDQKKQWAIAKLRNIASKCVSAQWERHNVSGEEFAPQKILDLLLKILKQDSMPGEKEQFSEINDGLSITLAKLRAMTSVTHELMIFEVYLKNFAGGVSLPINDATKHAVDVIFKSAKAAADEIVGDDLGEKDKTIAVLSLVNQATTIYTAAITHEVNRAVKWVNGLPEKIRKSAIEKTMEKSPCIISLAKVDKIFDYHFSSTISSVLGIEHDKKNSP